MTTRIALLLTTVAVGAADAALLDTRYWEAGHLEAIRAGRLADDPAVTASLESLRREADDALRDGPYTVVDKAIVPPSGDKHDYLSFSRYWWPNPDTPDGLPYIRRDGEVNRKLLANGDRVRIGRMYDDFEALALAAYLINEQVYAPKAVETLRTWFLDPATRMNPNLNFAQGVPGKAAGRAPGIIDTRHFIRVIEGVALLESIGRIEPAEVMALRAWFDEFLTWLLESELGRKERAAANNHGFWFAAQAARIAVFVGKPDVAAELIEETLDRRMAEGFEADGSQPEELKRTQSLHYSLFSLSALTSLARLAEGSDISADVWSHVTPNGASVRAAMDFAAPFAAKPGEWTHPQIKRFKVSDRQSMLFYLAASRLDEPAYLDHLDLSDKRFQGRHLAPLMFSRPDSARQ
ncbi:MAG: alginate lyase family protein [Planctomycetota bacterium]